MATILLIDDDESLRNTLQRVLAAAGHAVTTARDGVEGVRLYRAEPADLVITDIFMPDQDGLGIIMALRREYPGVRILAMSGSSSGSPNWLAVAAQLGARRTLKKPFTISQLMAAIAEVLPACPEPLGQA